VPISSHQPDGGRHNGSTMDWDLPPDDPGSRARPRPGRRPPARAPPGPVPSAAPKSAPGQPRRDGLRCDRQGRRSHVARTGARTPRPARCQSDQCALG
jgi:hypothetical protein